MENDGGRKMQMEFELELTRLPTATAELSLEETVREEVTWLPTVLTQPSSKPIKLLGGRE